MAQRNHMASSIVLGSQLPERQTSGAPPPRRAAAHTETGGWFGDSSEQADWSTSSRAASSGAPAPLRERNVPVDQGIFSSETAPPPAAKGSGMYRPRDEGIFDAAPADTGFQSRGAVSRRPADSGIFGDASDAPAVSRGVVQNRRGDSDIFGAAEVQQQSSGRRVANRRGDSDIFGSGPADSGTTTSRRHVNQRADTNIFGSEFTGEAAAQPSQRTARAPVSTESPFYTDTGLSMETKPAVAGYSAPQPYADGAGADQYDDNVNTARARREQNLRSNIF